MTEADEKHLLQALQDARDAIERPCEVCKQLDRMTDETAAVMKQALDAPSPGRIGSGKLSQILLSSGFPAGERAVEFHRSGHTKRRRG